MATNLSNIFKSGLILSALVAILAGFSGCSTPVGTGLGAAKLDEFKQIALELPVHPSFRKVDEYSGAKVDTANMGWNYKSSTTYEEVRQYYVEKLGDKSWVVVSEEKMSDWFADSGGKKITFQKSDIKFSIQYAPSSSNYGWNYALDLSYGS